VTPDTHDPGNTAADRTATAVCIALAVALRCQTMYEVYSTQRPGRPKWALAAGAILLLLAVGLAEALIYHRTHMWEVSLGASQEYVEGGIRARVPAGWRQIPEAECPPGTVIGVTEPATKNRPGRLLYLFRAAPKVNGTPLLHGFAAALDMATALGAGALMGGPTAGFASVDSLPAVSLFTGPGTEFGSPTEDESPAFCCTRVAVGPGGEIVGLALEASRPLGNADRRLLDQVAESVELLDVPLNVEAAKAMSAAGIRFQPPQDARFTGVPDPSVPRVRMMGGQGKGVWYLDVYRVPLIGPRTPAALVQDHALAAAQEVRLREPVESVRVGQRETAWARVSVVTGQKPSVFIQASRVDEQTGLLMLARYESEAEALVRNLCRSIAADAQVSPYAELVDTAQALDAGRRHLREIARDGLGKRLSRVAGKVERFTLMAPALVLGEETDTCRHAMDGDVDKWDLTSKYDYKIPGSEAVAISSVEEYQISNDGVEYQYSHSESLGRQTQLRCSESRQRGASRVERQVQTVHGNREETIEVDDTYCCDPVLMDLGARMSRDPHAGPAVVSTTETYARGVVYCVLTSIGRARMPGGPLRESARAVRIQRDYDPAPILVYYDDAGVDLGLSFDGLQWSESMTDVEQQAPGGRGLRRAPQGSAGP
jgi:hypothetical protein